MSMVIFSFTQNGTKISTQLNDSYTSRGEMVISYAPSKYASSGVMELMDLNTTTGENFVTGNTLIYIGAVGIAVRAIAPFVRSKETDPSVIVIDEQGCNVIPILSGHIGGANELARQLAADMGANAIITTATDINNKFAVDVFASKNELMISDMDIAKKVSSALVNGENVAISGDIPRGKLPEGLVYASEDNEASIAICISSSIESELHDKYEDVLYLIPKNLVVGIGCKKGVDGGRIERFVEEVLCNDLLIEQGIVAIASIDIKADEAGIINLANKLGVPFLTYAAEILQNVDGVFESSQFVETVTGVDNVCERAAVACGNGEIIVHKTVGDGVTVAISRLREKELYFE